MCFYIARKSSKPTLWVRHRIVRALIGHFGRADGQGFTSYIKHCRISGCEIRSYPYIHSVEHWKSYGVASSFKALLNFTIPDILDFYTTLAENSRIVSYRRQKHNDFDYRPCPRAIIQWGLVLYTCKPCKH